jgi:5-methylcytosine-specific restriction endonuclease McrA
MGHTLALNADWQPISLLPLSSLSWQDAIKAVYLDAARPLHVYEGWQVKSPSRTFNVPSVIIFKDYIKFRRGLGYSKDLLYLRDGYTCQYCLKVFPSSKLTVDHVIPKSKKGGTGYLNFVASCEPCNFKRGNDTRIQPKTKPYRPTYHELVKKYRAFPISIPHESWKEYIGWEENLIRINPPSGEPGYTRLETEPERLAKKLGLLDDE